MAETRMAERWAIVLAGGAGSRLHPLTLGLSKQRLPVFDKPLIYYPLCTALLCGFRRLLLISAVADLPGYRQLLGDGSDFGIQLEYATQSAPRGVAEAFLLAADRIGGEPVSLILGDNVFLGDDWQSRLAPDADGSGATVFAAEVHDARQFGVVELDERERPVALEEKPTRPRSNLAVTGLYHYDQQVWEMAAGLRPSPRGELEITDINRAYLDRGQLQVKRLRAGERWLDAATADGLWEASTIVRELQAECGRPLSSIEAIAFRLGYIDAAALRRRAERMANSDYGRYLLELAGERLA